MPSDAEKSKASGLRWAVFSIGIAICGFALGWAFKGRQPENAKPEPAIIPPSSVTASTPEAPLVSEQPLQSASEQDLLQDLRAKLQTSRDDVINSLAEIAKTRPALAIDLAQALGRTPEEKAEWVTNLTQQWADQDPQAAWKWLSGLPSRRMQELGNGDLTPVVLGAMAARDPKMVLANVDTLLRSGNNSESVSTPVAVHVGLDALIASGQLDLARQAVESWAKDPNKLNIEAAAYESVAMAMTGTAPVETGEWLRSLPKSEERNSAFATFAATWAEKDPGSALKWAETLPADEGRQAALGRTVSDWVEQYPKEVSGWLGDYLARAPANAESDQLVATVLNLSPVVKNNPQVALQWTELISDPQQRSDHEERVALRWARQDRNAAMTHIQSSQTLTSEQKTTLIQRIQNNDFSSISEE
jgi:hypothetical protein